MGQISDELTRAGLGEPWERRARVDIARLIDMARQGGRPVEDAVRRICEIAHEMLARAAEANPCEPAPPRPSSPSTPEKTPPKRSPVSGYSSPTNDEGRARLIGQKARLKLTARAEEIKNSIFERIVDKETNKRIKDMTRDDWINLVRRGDLYRHWGTRVLNEFNWTHGGMKTSEVASEKKLAEIMNSSPKLFSAHK